MNKNRIPYILFSLVLIAVFILTAIPAPAYALSASSSRTSLSAQQGGGTDPGVVVRVCRTVGVERNGHTVWVRRCHLVRGTR